MGNPLNRDEQNCRRFLDALEELPLSGGLQKSTEEWRAELPEAEDAGLRDVDHQLAKAHLGGDRSEFILVCRHGPRHCQCELLRDPPFFGEFGRGQQFRGEDRSEGHRQQRCHTNSHAAIVRAEGRFAYYCATSEWKAATSGYN